MNHLNYRSHAKQEGYILLMTVILLLLLTILGLNLVSLNTTQTRVASNATTSEVSFDKTEGAVNEAINYLLNGTYKASSFLKNANGFYLFDPSVAPLWTTINWQSSASITSNFQGNTTTKANYIIEQLPSVILPGQNMKTTTYIFRITAIGTNGNASVLIQSTVQLQ